MSVDLEIPDDLKEQYEIWGKFPENSFRQRGRYLIERIAQAEANLKVAEESMAESDKMNDFLEAKVAELEAQMRTE